MNAKILFVEDELSLQKSIAFILEKEGFTVISARTGEEAIPLAVKEKPDLLLLDLMLPGIDGFEVCKILKKNPQTAEIFIVMLSSKRMVADVARGLNQYADDYITKPFEPPILIARIHAILRRKLKIVSNETCLMEFEGFTIDLNARELSVKGEKVVLTKTEFDLLVLLARNPNIVLTRSKVLDYIREGDYDITERIVDYQISSLRKKLPYTGQCIETVWGVGYKFRV